MTVLERLGDWLWNPWLLGLFLLSGLYFSIESGFFQIFGVKKWLGVTVGQLLGGKQKGTGRGLTRFQAMSTALASTIGTGSIAGVATAIFFGGPGAVFWMWVSAFLGMMTSFVEKTLAVRWRERGRDGLWQGGPMCYIARGLGSPFLAAWFSLSCVASSLAGGNLVQSNSIAASLEAAFGWDRLAVGIVTALLTGAVILGGIGRIGKVSEKLVPCMALLFLGGG
ncbi:alanine:cation symporter family protein, partial [Pseudoflavonifractor phocaeensis]|uniref:alanine:cation symporter family protein n=1 Tax=Pseudoflavonifractor phocaeensis TaxID=1870988 RepID=UPI00195E536C